MKKTLILLAAVALNASAGSFSYNELSSELKEGVIAAWDFNESGAPLVNVGSVDYHNDFATSDGLGLVSTNAHPWTSGITSVTGDFTISMDIHSLVSNSWCSLLTLHGGGTASGDANSLQVQAAGGNSLMVYMQGFGGNSGKEIDPGIQRGTDMGGITLALVYTANTATGDGATPNGTLAAYVNGGLVGTLGNLTSTHVLTGLEFGGSGGGNRGITSASIDNVIIWNRALSATEVAQLPEPATATLSLLALAGLAARRRR